MTREETVKNLLTELIDMIDNGSQRDLDRADEIAKTIIKALSQEPCDDVVSRQDALNCLNGAWGDYSVLNEVYERISKLPPVTQKSKTGHWTRELIRNEKGGCIGAKMICSRCGNDNKHDEYMSYCPNCGAKMESEN